MTPQPDRIERLETLFMEHESTLERYGELIRDQQRQLSELADSLELLREKLSQYEDTGPPEPPFQPPPHY